MVRVFRVCAFCRYYDPNYHILYEATNDEKYKNLGYCEYSEQDDTINQSTGPSNWCDNWKAATLEELHRRRYGNNEKRKS